MYSSILGIWKGRKMFTAQKQYAIFYPYLNVDYLIELQEMETLLILLIL